MNAKSNAQSPRRGKALFRTKDEVLPDGSVVLWSKERRYRETPNSMISGYQLIQVKCGDCRVIYWKPQPSISRSRKRSSGRCKKCGYSDKSFRDSLKRVSSNGYTYVSINSFSSSEQRILATMFIKCGSRRYKRIAEHRAIVALSLGRPLESYEIVHHKNGIKNDNRLENLELMVTKLHHSGYSSAGTLELSIVKLRKQLLDAGIVPCC
jgi:hypothetical protein